MKAAATILALLAISLILLGIADVWCDRDRADIDRAKFDEIRSYWQTKFPTRTFEPNLHLASGPRLDERWIYVSIPAELDELYHHRFSEMFLIRLKDDPDGLNRMIAEEVLLLRETRGPSSESLHTDGITYKSYTAIERHSLLQRLRNQLFR
jgi:hypothetical protein